MEKIYQQLEWYNQLLNKFQKWTQSQLEQHWISIPTYHMAHELLMNAKTKLDSYNPAQDTDLQELQFIQSKFATFITQFGSPSLTIAVQLLVGTRMIYEIMQTDTKAFNVDFIETSVADVWSILDELCQVQQVSMRTPPSEPVSITNSVNLYQVEHDVSDIQSFRHSLTGIYVAIHHKKETFVFHCTLPPLTIHEIPQLNIDSWKKDLMENRPDQDCFRNDSFLEFLKNYLFTSFLFSHTKETIYMNYYGLYGWSQKTLQEPMNQLIRQFHSLPLHEKFDWLYRGLVFRKVHHEWSQLVFIMFDVMHKYKSDSIHYKGHTIETPIISTTWEQSQLFHWLPSPLKQQLGRTIKDSFEQHIQLEGNDGDPNEYLPMEQRIQLMKASNSTKQRALAKWQEVKLKPDEMSSKARQYVEGLLRIPFGTYKEEPCLKLFDDILHKENEIQTILFETKCGYTKSQSIQWYISELDNLPVKRKELMEMGTFMNQLFEEYDITHHSVHMKHCELCVPIVPIRFTGKRQNIIKQLFRDTIQWIIDNSHHVEFLFVLHAIICYVYRDNPPNVNRMIQPTLSRINPLETKLATTMSNTASNTMSNTTSKEESQISLWYPPECFTQYSTLVNFFATQGLPNCHLLKTPLMSSFLHDLYKQQNPWNAIQSILTHFNETLEQSIYGHRKAKRQIERILGQWVRGEQTGYCFGFEGPPGVGKTSLAKNGLSKCLVDEHGNSRPFEFIALGGSTHGNTLEGHNYTYLGSTWGKLVDILMETNCMNPIIFIDELDKVSQTDQGREIIGILTHLVDPTQNQHIQDKYFNGIDLDFSKALIVFSYNNVDAIDSILLDRIHRVQFSPLSLDEKIVIAHKYIIPELEQKFNWNLINQETGQSIFTDTILKMIIETYTREAGVRKFKEIMFEITSEMNLETMVNQEQSLEILTEEKIHSYLKERTRVIHRIVESTYKAGIVNGLWANSLGQGGVLTVETSWCPSKEPLQLVLTGLQGDVMKESMTVAKTVVWNLLDEQSKERLQGTTEGIHIHCPEGATPKDGPSAGCAIALAILSLMSNRNIPSRYAFTGELSLNNKITAIGGLESKILGAIRSGVKTILYPKENERDLEQIQNTYPNLNIQCQSVEQFQDVIDIVWTKE